MSALFVSSTNRAVRIYYNLILDGSYAVRYDAAISGQPTVQREATMPVNVPGIVSSGIDRFDAIGMHPLIDQESVLSFTYIDLIGYEVVGRVIELWDSSFDIMAAGQRHNFSYRDVLGIGYAPIGSPSFLLSKSTGIMLTPLQTAD